MLCIKGCREEFGQSLFFIPFFLKTFYIVDFHKTAPNMQWDLMFSQIFDWQISCRCLFYSLILLVYTLFHFVIQTLYIFLSPYSFSSGFAFFLCQNVLQWFSNSCLIVVLQPCTEIRNCNHNTYSSSTLSWLWARESWNPLFFLNSWNLVLCH